MSSNEYFFEVSVVADSFRLTVVFKRALTMGYIIVVDDARECHFGRLD